MQELPLAYIHIILTFSTAAISAALSVYAWRQRDIPGAAAYVLLMVVASGYSLTTGMVIVSNTPQTTHFWENIRWFFVSMLPVMLLLFTLDYTGNTKWLKPPRVIL